MFGLESEPKSESFRCFLQHVFLGLSVAAVRGWVGLRAIRAFEVAFPADVRMIKFNMFLPKGLLKWLRDRAKQEGVPTSEVVRRALLEFMQRNDK